MKTRIKYLLTRQEEGKEMTAGVFSSRKKSQNALHEITTKRYENIKRSMSDAGCPAIECLISDTVMTIKDNNRILAIITIEGPKGTPKIYTKVRHLRIRHKACYSDDIRDEFKDTTDDAIEIISEIALRNKRSILILDTRNRINRIKVETNYTSQNIIYNVERMEEDTIKKE